MNIRYAAAFLLAGVALPGAAYAQEAPAQIVVPPLAFTERTLPNGLRVIAIRDTATPTVSVQVWYDVGSKHDPEGRSGFAHLFEHILSRKTRNMPYNMINRLTENVGGVRNASTWFDRTNYYETVPAQYLETMLWTHAERMARPVVDAEVFETERKVVKEEYRQRVLSPAYGRLRLVMDENSYDALPNRRPGIGSLEQLDAATLEDARAFHEAYYGPDTATLIVAGNFDPATLDTLVNRYFESIPRRKNPIPLAIKAVEKPRTIPRQVTAYAPNVPLPLIASTWRIPGSAHPDIAPLMVLDGILATGDSSRLKQALVFDKAIATSVYTNNSDVEDGGFLAPVVTLASGTAVEDAEKALAAEIAKLRDQPVTAAELAEAKNEILAAALRERETASGRAFALGEALVRSGDSKSLDKRLAQIGKVTIADVQRVARKYLTPESRVDIRYLDESKRHAGEKDNWANPVKMPAWASVPPATGEALTLAPEGERQSPPEPSAAVPVTPPAIAEGQLANGMKLVSARTGNVPIATIALVFKGGNATDPAGRAGLAYMAAQLATKGTASRSAKQIAAQLEALGADLGATASADGTVLSITAPVASLDAAGAILADIARNASFPGDEFEKERKRTIDQLQVGLKDPGSVAGMTLTRAMYGAAPYGGVSTPKSLGNLSREDLLAQRDRWWRPDTATLIVTGGIASADAKRIADKLFGSWQASGPAPITPAAPGGEAAKPRLIVVDMPGAGQSAVAAGLRIPQRSDPAFPDLMVANAVLGAGSNGRLFQEVRVKRALSYGAYSSLSGRAGPGIMVASAQTKNESAPEVVDVFLAEIKRLSAEPLDATTTAQRVAFLQGGIGRQSESSAGFASTLASLTLQGLPPATAATLRDRIGAVTPEAAAAAARASVDSSRASIVIVGDAKLFLDKLRAAHPEVEVIPAASLDLDAPLLGGR
ncbi:MAG: insulinase family protein [Sphingomonadales bacterium]|nr:MAG: insulinase family protein [Sphingomonadales bacterium]